MKTGICSICCTRTTHSTIQKRPKHTRIEFTIRTDVWHSLYTNNTTCMTSEYNVTSAEFCYLWPRAKNMLWAELANMNKLFVSVHCWFGGFYTVVIMTVVREIIIIFGIHSIIFICEESKLKRIGGIQSEQTKRNPSKIATTTTTPMSDRQFHIWCIVPNAISIEFSWQFLARNEIRADFPLFIALSLSCFPLF